VLLEGGHAQRIAEPHAWSKRELWTAAVATVVVLATIALGLFAFLDRPAKDPSCLSVTAATSTGGAPLEACGAKARQWCRTPLEAAGGGERVAAAIRAQCRSKRLD
jgi:hypothetical protein